MFNDCYCQSKEKNCCSFINCCSLLCGLSCCCNFCNCCCPPIPKCCPCPPKKECKMSFQEIKRMVDCGNTCYVLLCCDKQPYYLFAYYKVCQLCPDHFVIELSIKEYDVLLRCLCGCNKASLLFTDENRCEKKSVVMEGYIRIDNDCQDYCNKIKIIAEGCKICGTKTCKCYC